MEETMKKIGRRMSLCMGVSLSFCLSFIGTLTSGNFTLPGFLISFVLSTIISLIIGFLVPMKKVSDASCKKLHLEKGLARKLWESLLSDLIYTPVITLAMVSFAWKMATSHGAKIPFLPMFLKSLLITFVAGYVIIFILTPVFMKLVTKDLPAGGRPGNPV